MVLVGFTAGFGELMGYGFRSVTGYFADKTHKYWVFIFAGYFVNMLAVPALALAGNWPLAAVLIVAERTGRAIRKPSTDALLSHAGSQIGHGWAFGLNEFLDQTGATIGPLIMALILYFHGGYHKAFALLLIPALLCLGAVTVARMLYPRPHELETRLPVKLETRGFSKTYWLYVVAGALIAAGFADFSLIAFHFQKAGVGRAKVSCRFFIPRRWSRARWRRWCSEDCWTNSGCRPWCWRFSSAPSSHRASFSADSRWPWSE